MKYTKIHKLLGAMAAVALLTGCDLNEEPQAQASTDMIFSSETGLKTYAYSFYNVLPSRADAIKQDLNQCDYLAHKTLSALDMGTYLTTSASSWSWTAVRNINFFLEHNNDSRVSELVRNNYNGIARLFRARFYYEKLKVFGGVPYVGKVFNEVDDPELMAPRDTRDVIIEHIIEDLDYAYENIQQKTPTLNSSSVTRWVAMAYKSRVLLYEASWRKYHAGTDFVKGCDKYTSDELYQMAAEAAKEVMDNGPYKLYTSGANAYRTLFSSDNAVTTEVMLAQVCDEELGAMGEANRWYNLVSYGAHASMSRKFALSYLNKDGSVFTDLKSDGKHKSFKEETTNRDPRLGMTVRAWDYQRKNTAGNMEYTAAPFTGPTLTGYHFIKYVLDDANLDDNSLNTNDVPLMRYAEVLLNYAEAMAELGKMDNDIWAATIGALRKRAGITGGTTATGTLTTMPSGTPDKYIADYYPGVTDPVILEVRRERACELCLEGFRPDDLKRWRMGELFVSDPWEGIFFPAMNTPLDINEDGVEDVYFYTAKKIPQSKYSNIGLSLLTSSSNPKGYTEVADGYLLKFAIEGRNWPERQYLRPIPQEVIQKNPNLKQNPGWEGH